MERIKVYPDKLGSDRPSYVQELVNDDDYEFGQGIYLHGQLEELNGYDITIFPDKNVPTSDGVYPVEVRLAEEFYMDAVMYLWYRGERKLGLIVRKSDREYVLDAEKKYKERAVFI